MSSLFLSRSSLPVRLLSRASAGLELTHRNSARSGDYDEDGHKFCDENNPRLGKSYDFFDEGFGENAGGIAQAHDFPFFFSLEKKQRRSKIEWRVGRISENKAINRSK